MVSFADMLALTLTFFVLLFSMRSVPFEEWHVLVNALRSELDQPALAVEQPDAAPDDRPAPILARAIEVLSLDYLKALIRDVDLSNDPAAGGIRLSREHERLVVSIPQAVLFEPASALLRPAARDLLQRLAGRLELLPNGLIVRTVGESGMNHGEYPGSWELALAQGQAVAAVLAGSGYGAELGILVSMDLPLSEADRALPLARQQDRLRRLDLILMDYGRGTDDVAAF